jgi:hypothetical protein
MKCKYNILLKSIKQVLKYIYLKKLHLFTCKIRKYVSYKSEMQIEYTFEVNYADSIIYLF